MPRQSSSESKRSKNKMYDLAIIGAGPAGIGCAKGSLNSGLKTVLIEKDEQSFGGTCINVGCIPTKFFLTQSKSGKSWGDISPASKEVIDKIKSPLLKFLQNGGLDVVWGKGCFCDKNTIEVEGKKIQAKHIVIATGSRPIKIFDHPKVIFAEQIFEKKDIGKKVLIIGGGYIGLEMASLFNSLGKEVALIEKEKRILPNFDKSLSQRLKTILVKKGIKIQENKDASGVNFDDFDLVISAVGRAPNTSGLGLEKIGINLKAQGWIKTDEHLQTNIKDVYACGDVTGKELLAYVAEYQASLCIKNITNLGEEENYSGLPECVFSIPSVAKVGILEEEAKEKNIKYRVIKSNFLKFSSSYVYEDLDGFIQVLVDDNDKILGAGIISNEASELISLFSFCIRHNLKLSDLKDNLFIHPTFSEIIPLLFR